MKLFLAFYNHLSTKLKKNFFLNIILSLLGIVMEILSLVILIPVIRVMINDQYLKEFSNLFFTVFNSKIEKKEIYFMIFLILVITYLFRFFILMGVVWFQNNFSAKVELLISKKLTKNLLNTKFTEFIKYDSSFHLNIIQIDLPRMSDYFLRVLYLSTELIMMLSIMVTVTFLNPFGILILAIIISPVLYLTFKKLNNKFLFLGNQNVSKEHELTKTISDLIKFFKEIKIYGIQEKYYKLFKRNKEVIADISIKKGTIEALPRYLFETFAVIFFLLYLLIIFTIKELDIETILLNTSIFGLAGVKLLPSINKIFNSVNAMKFNQKSTEIILKSLDSFSHKEFNTNSKARKIESIEMKNVSFSYNNTRILNKFNFEVIKGDVVYVSGDSGKGKTTVLNLILGLLKFDNGEYLINKKPYHFPLFQNHKIGFVAQKPLLISGSIKENIVLDSIKIDLEKLKKVIKISCIDQLVTDLGLGYDVGVDGTNLSGGQAQRICIARAIYNSDEILILDEATNSIDITMRDKVFKNILNYSKKKIVIFTSHDEGLIKFSNKKIILN